jgi:hypothetical protein
VKDKITTRGRRGDPTRMFVHKDGCAELPWRVSEFKGDEPYNAHIMPAEGHLPVANIIGIRVGARESAVFIVKACNSYESLIEDQARLLLKIASLSGALKDFVEACTDDKRYPTLCTRASAALQVSK